MQIETKTNYVVKVKDNQEKVWMYFEQNNVFNTGEFIYSKEDATFFSKGQDIATKSSAIQHAYRKLVEKDSERYGNLEIEENCTLITKSTETHDWENFLKEKEAEYYAEMEL